MISKNFAKKLEPAILLFAAGGFIGLIFPLAQLAGEYGISPVIYSAISASGASIVLLGFTRFTGEKVTMNKPDVRYALIAGQLTFSIPFGTLVAVIPLIGSGIPAILQSLAPIITLGIAIALRLEKPNFLRGAGLALGLVGVLLVLIPRGDPTGGPSDLWLWYMVALITPITLAFGNVYRTTAWPAGSNTLSLAVLTLAFAGLGLILLTILFVTFGRIENPFAGMALGWPVIALQCLFTGIGYGLFFRLQKVGGPVYLSQISYVNTGVGIIFAVMVFSERLPITAWISVACIFVGIALLTLTSVRRSAS